MSWFRREECPPITTEPPKVFPDEDEIEIVPDMVDEDTFHIHLPKWFTGEKEEDEYPPIEVI